MIKTRTEKSLRNVSFALTGKILQLALTFVVRTLILKKIGEDILGLDGVFNSVIAILSLAELGVGSAIMFSLYKPIAENDQEKIVAYLRFFNKVYSLIALIIFVIGMALIPFLDVIVNLPTDVSNLYVVYTLCILDTSCSYLFSNRKILFEADQNNYVVSIADMIKTILLQVSTIIAIILTHNYLLILIVRLSFTLIYNIIIYFYAQKKYPILKTKLKVKLSKRDKKDLFANTGALMCTKLGGVMLTGADNIIISACLGTVLAGYYGNYFTITSGVLTIIYLIFTALTPSLGNLKQTNNDIEHHYQIFETIYLGNYLISSFFAVVMFCVFNPFITIWIGERYLFSVWVVALISCVFYFMTTKSFTGIFISASGYFKQTMLKSVFEGIINITASLIAVRYLGIAGVFIGTILALVLGSLWVDPWVLFKKWFKKPVWKFFLRYIIDTCICIGIGAVAYYVCSLITNENNLINLVLRFLTASAIGLSLLVLSVSGRKSFKTILKRIFSFFKHKGKVII